MILNFVEDYFLFNCWMIYFHIWTNGWALLFTHHASGLNGFDYLILTENLKRILFGIVNLLFSNLKLNMMIWNDEPNFSRISWNLNLWNVFYGYYIIILALARLNNHKKLLYTPFENLAAPGRLCYHVWIDRTNLVRFPTTKVSFTSHTKLRRANDNTGRPTTNR